MQFISMTSPNFSANNPPFACMACGQMQHRVMREKNQFEMRQCLYCKTIFTQSQLVREVLKDLYDHYYDNAHFDTSSVVMQSLERIVLSFASYRSSNQLLDIGFGEGGLLRIAEKLGWECYGTEISPQSLVYGKQQGWVVSDQARHDERFIAQSFDVVTMIELLEHVQNPLKVLQAAAHWLRPGGLLYLTTPNARSLNQRILGTGWSVISPPEHITIWSVKGLRQILSKAGFQPLQIRTEGLNPFEILARFRPKPEAVNRNQTGYALNQTFSSSPARRALKTGINHLLSALQLGDGLKVYATRNR